MPSVSTPHFITVLTQHGETHLPFRSGTNLLEILNEAGFLISAECNGRAVCGQCKIRLEDTPFTPPTEGETRHFNQEQLAQGARLACQIFPQPGMHLTLHEPTKSRQWRSLREDEYCPLIIPPPLPSNKPGHGLAIDIGTTHIRLTLWQLNPNRRLAGRTGINPQIAHGADVLTRLMVADHSPKLARQLSALIVHSINEALVGMAEETGIPNNQIGSVAIVGNTAMLALLSGKNHQRLMDPQQWTGIIDYQPENTDFLREAWHLADNAEISFLPPMGGFVGSDLLAGIIATGLMDGPPGSLLIDFGTNSEMALWDGKLLRITSTAGGPAFEGSGIGCGMPAETGAIYRVADTSTDHFDLFVVGEGNPQGICGSGLVDVMACLRRMGNLDKVGRLKNVDKTGIVLAQAEHSVTLNASDIDVFQRAKAAIGAGVVWLCHEAGVRPDELQRVCVCGAFGRLLDVANAQEIGLLPPVSRGCIELNANTALAGCEMLLLAADSMERLSSIQSRAQVFNLAEDMIFESLFIQNLYVQPIQD